ncbi:MAG TPA: nitroreductase family deazaflavin-dependent oxidoreductase [Acidimicrobiales bacterium]|nr:nitroreductase family deazaflavin-dependent oxidoreductase [Acidimicrobiales bacterium]
MSDPNDWNRQIIDEFRANSGRVSSFGEVTLLLLHTKGARTGTERINPLAYQRLGPTSVAIFASKAGAPNNPDWYHNIVANPDVTVEIGDQTHKVRARVASGEERSQIWERQKTAVPGFADYEQKTSRQIPVIILDEI